MYIDTDPGTADPATCAISIPFYQPAGAAGSGVRLPEYVDHAAQQADLVLFGAVGLVVLLAAILVYIGGHHLYKARHRSGRVLR